jgi:hypothetical protein
MHRCAIWLRDAHQRIAVGASTNQVRLDATEPCLVYQSPCLRSSLGKYGVLSCFLTLLFLRHLVVGRARSDHGDRTCAEASVRQPENTAYFPTLLGVKPAGLLLASVSTSLKGRTRMPACGRKPQTRQRRKGPNHWIIPLRHHPCWTISGAMRSPIATAP